ncbi:hypothetical protein ACFQZX_10305 [Mucilaginibacter litoreus]|uniref:Uncharacterized protein n=1 Tax=Mucilaginibacter litoreus TaxID=1048221 RepID=A0ABW3ASH6_9SPHI
MARIKRNAAYWQRRAKHWKEKFEDFEIIAACAERKVHRDNAWLQQNYPEILEERTLDYQQQADQMQIELFS